MCVEQAGHHGCTPPFRQHQLAWLQVLVAERGPLVFVFNFSPFNDYEGLQVTLQLVVM
jgi:hypothetical protein